MFRISVRKSVLDILQREIITSGSVNIYTASFTFDSAWEGLERIAVFQIGTDAVSICLGEENCCTIPWEVLQAPNYILRVGVYGTRGGEVVLPTIWGELGRIREGVHLGGSAQPPTPGLIDQILAKIGNLEELDTSSKESLVAAVNELYAGGTEPVTSLMAGDMGIKSVLLGPDTLYERPGGYVYIKLTTSASTEGET